MAYCWISQEKALNETTLNDICTKR